MPDDNIPTTLVTADDYRVTSAAERQRVTFSSQLDERFFGSMLQVFGTGHGDTPDGFEKRDRFYAKFYEDHGLKDPSGCGLQ